MKLIVGLGNPGKEYAANRHNLGFRCINHLAKAHGIGVDKRQCQAQLGVGRIAGVQVVLAKPKTYMNLSGKSVHMMMDRFKAKREDIVIIHDDLDLPVGRIRFYANCGPGGHKGVESIIAALGSRDFVRIRVGVGRPPPGTGTAIPMPDGRNPSRLWINDLRAPHSRRPCPSGHSRHPPVASQPQLPLPGGWAGCLGIRRRLFHDGWRSSSCQHRPLGRQQLASLRGRCWLL